MGVLQKARRSSEESFTSTPVKISRNVQTYTGKLDLGPPDILPMRATAQYYKAGTFAEQTGYTCGNRS